MPVYKAEIKKLNIRTVSSKEALACFSFWEGNRFQFEKGHSTGQGLGISTNAVNHSNNRTWSLLWPSCVVTNDLRLSFPERTVSVTGPPPLCPFTNPPGIHTFQVHWYISSQTANKPIRSPQLSKFLIYSAYRSCLYMLLRIVTYKDNSHAKMPDRQITP